jgi:putative AdoMet-dependent methyltransferase
MLNKRRLFQDSIYGDKMTGDPLWQYDEFEQVGTDYNDLAQVQAYDERHSQFRDVEKECQTILDVLKLSPDARLIEFGTGTGAFAIAAARCHAKVYAVDVSQLMLEYAAKKADDAGVNNISFHHRGFLTYAQQDQPVDAIVTAMAFHHLPDFWKGLALGRMYKMLKSGGKLYVHDVIFSETNTRKNIAGWIDHLAETGGAQLGEEVAAHVREEYSTFDWIMEGLLTRAGFVIKDIQVNQGVISTYQCVKE